MADAVNAQQRNLYPRKDGSRYTMEYSNVRNNYSEALRKLSWTNPVDVPAIGQESAATHKSKLNAVYGFTDGLHYVHPTVGHTPSPLCLRRLQCGALASPHTYYIRGRPSVPPLPLVTLFDRRRPHTPCTQQYGKLRHTDHLSFSSMNGHQIGVGTLADPKANVYDRLYLGSKTLGRGTTRNPGARVEMAGARRPRVHGACTACAYGREYVCDACRLAMRRGQAKRSLGVERGSAHACTGIACVLHAPTCLSCAYGD